MIFFDPTSLPSLHPGAFGESGSGGSGEHAALDTQTQIERQQPFGMARVEVLETYIEWPRWCSICESEETFTAAMKCRFGLIGCCRTCANECIVPFSRSGSEVA
jgi:hypothetical protein